MYCEDFRFSQSSYPHLLTKMLLQLAVVAILLQAGTDAASQDQIFSDIFSFWSQFRDPQNGFWCDTLRFPSSGSLVPCGDHNNFYSSAGTGMGLLSEAIFTELGYIDREEANIRVVQSLTSLLTLWPRERFSGFMVHFTNRNLDALSEFSTIDTSELVLGALFAGNYFGGEVLDLAVQLRDATNWSDAILAEDNPTIYPIVDYETGELRGNIRPYNEYYLVAYIANMTSPSGSKASKYFETYYMATQDSPVGDGTYPVHKNYWGYDLLTDNPNIFMSSFIPQFNYYLSRGYQASTFYTSMSAAWLQADMKYWSLALPEDSNIWGTPVKDRVWGAGAGPAPSGYSVERIDRSPDLVISAAIMAGFLPAADEQLKDTINDQLAWLYDNNICAYSVQLPDGSSSKILWRCSVRLPDWRAGSVDSIDFSTMVLGFATNYLPSDFYSMYAA